jgi:hypothetical protein
VLSARNTERTQAADTHQTQVAVWATQIATQAPPERVDTLPSPDGQHRLEQWRTVCVEVRGLDSQPARAAYEQLILVGANTGRKVIETQVRYCEGLGAYGLAPVRWSRDSRFV